MLLSHNHPLNHVWSLLDAYSLLFPSAKVCFGSNYRILRSKRKPQHNAIIFIFDVLIWSSDHEVWSLTAQRNVLNMCIFAKNILLPCQRQLFCVSLKKQCTCFSSIPCKIRTGILVGSRRDLGGNPAGIPARFWPPGFFFPAGISPRSRQDSRQEAKFPAAKISPGSCRETRQDSRQEAKIPAAKISVRSCRKSCQDSRREAKIPAAKISPGSCRESRQDSRREEKIPSAKISARSYRESRQDSRRGANSRWQKSGRDLAGNLGKILDMLPRVSFRSSPMFTCLKIQTKVS